VGKNGSRASKPKPETDLRIHSSTMDEFHAGDDRASDPDEGGDIEKLFQRVLPVQAILTLEVPKPAEPSRQTGKGKKKK